MYGWRIAVAVTVLSDPGWVAAADRLPPPPREWHEPGVYVKHLLQDGILILGTRSAPDRALREAAQLLWNTRPFEKYHAVLRRHRLRMIAVGPFEVPPERPPDWTAAHWAEWWRSHPFGGRQVNDAVRPRCYFSDRAHPGGHS